MPLECDPIVAYGTACCALESATDCNITSGDDVKLPQHSLSGNTEDRRLQNKQNTLLDKGCSDAYTYPEDDHQNVLRAVLLSYNIIERKNN
ncbi:hypothetical protein KIN20_006266 [Parelaphostrongylus tenuis]|uniref:Uncharacterized protein n=1 Tax=Parelaphostrongylus tenuis TaxID=148309 RepID=A0AAD5QJ83_PARTN|nr:hypothetical protein KIN20_006266 [Parelaphostrongylus tenuis]